MSLEQEKIDSFLNENKEKLADSLHKKSVVSSLRSYQGDIAKFIKEKNQSFIDITLKEKERKEEKEKKEENVSKQKNKNKISSSFMPLILSLFLLAGGIFISFYILKFKYSGETKVEIIQNSIIKSDQSIVMDDENLNANYLRENIILIKENTQEGQVVEIKITDSSSKEKIGILNFLQKIDLKAPDSLKRSFEGDFMLGVYGEKSEASLFIIIKEKDYGISFRDMLAWEPKFLEEIGFILPKVATSTEKIFKDLILWNKDTRAILNKNGELILCYTFLDKETILITESEKALKNIIDSYLVKNFIK